MIKTKGSNVIKILYHSLIYSSSYIYWYTLFLSLPLFLSLSLPLCPFCQSSFCFSSPCNRKYDYWHLPKFSPYSFNHWLDHQSDDPCRMSLGVFLPLQIFGRVSQVFSKCLIEFTCGAMWSWTFVCWKIFIHCFSISLLVVGLFILYISSWFSLGRLYLSKNLSISSRLSISLAYSCLK